MKFFDGEYWQLWGPYHHVAWKENEAGRGFVVLLFEGPNHGEAHVFPNDTAIIGPDGLELARLFRLEPDMYRLQVVEGFDVQGKGILSELILPSDTER